MSNAVGRPTDYKPEYCQMMIDYFNVPLYRTVKTKVKTRHGFNEIEKEVPNSFPTFEGFTRKVLGKCKQTIHNWLPKYPEFLDAYNLCKEIQKDFLIEHGLMDNYNPAFAKFLAVNVTDLRDSQTQIIDQKIQMIDVDSEDKEL